MAHTEKRMNFERVPLKSREGANSFGGKPLAHTAGETSERRGPLPGWDSSADLESQNSEEDNPPGTARSLDPMFSHRLENDLCDMPCILQVS